ncbi:MAG: feruloyl-CoA synthase [Deltaproteobacteria bacterium]|nr:MAG: feruloyl-CoA synthase [Deltaproteobacteria bacterium]
MKDFETKIFTTNPDPKGRIIPTLAPAALEVAYRDGGEMVLRSPQELAEYPTNICENLKKWAELAGDRTFIAQRNSEGEWESVTYSQALGLVRSIGQALLNMGLSAEKPVMILSDNSINVAMLILASMYVGVAVSPISQAYSLVSQDHEKLRHVYGIVRPGLVYAANGKRFSKALAALNLDGVTVVVENDPPTTGDTALFSELASTTPTEAVEEAFSRVTPDTIAKILFTSGSTNAPKGVINTQRMINSSQQSIAQIWPFLEEKPPVFLDWLPWNHTFGGNKSFNIILRNGGTLYIDAGKPVPGAIETTVKNLLDVSPTVSFNVPKGYDALLPYLESDAAVSESFFKNMDMIFYAAAALPQNLWTRLEKLSEKYRGEKLFMASGWGATETSPTIAMVHYPIEKAGVIGLPMPGFEIKLTPNAGKMEMRVKGPNITPGYYQEPELTKKAFDEEGFYCIGDAGKFADPDNPAIGLAFDGRVTEDFKLTTGTWVSVGTLRVSAIEAASPYIQDAVITGHNQDFIGIMVWPNLDECRCLAPECGDDPEKLIRSEAVKNAIREKLLERNQEQKGSSTRILRMVILSEPPSLDASEITDKGYINQRAVLENRHEIVAEIYEETPTDRVIVI